MLFPTSCKSLCILFWVLVWDYQLFPVLLIVQIPCLDEEATIGSVIREVPRSVPGVDRVLVLVALGRRRRCILICW